ncbi:uncharacterized protein TRAVEDRAFT_44353 [Trametes versicolor FP-101664 SS1]|uniref:uncharacterized protein n=1 Tax=Trametes versicolor (strain FP-101664) TaxID=717944 RepID=UPI0004623081|nr:uncharacterized protein TRAVEDRAFT_44353 [Trametes versicolor FP-101664 SS1]EIW61533.1 hypothetical protein TRAVEDRAFT_44353 [Trametes versicolor FP-101664 SS1]
MATPTSKWRLLNIDRQQQAETLKGTLESLLLQGTNDVDLGGHTALLNYLRTPCLPKEVDEWLTTGSIARQNCPLAWLPVELLSMIFDDLLMRDSVMFAITCKSLLIIGKCRLLAVLKSLHAPWQNSRLILLGIDIISGRADLPAGLLTDAEWRKIANAPLQKPRSGVALRITGLNLYGPRYHKAALGKLDPLYHLRRRVPMVLRSRDKGPSYGQWTTPSGGVSTKPSEGPSDFRLFSVLWGCAGVAYPEGARVLCNTVKGEYIREDTLTVAQDREDVTLAHALLARIAWANADYNIAVNCAEWAKAEIRRGSWAGDRFCVATMNTLPTLGPEVGPWKDVTDAVDRLLRHLKDPDFYMGHE